MFQKESGEETICGYLVSNNRKKLWKCELKMLELLENICQENNLNYFLIYGSALGAIRHQGFIPWDDDIDIGMIREDFEKLCDILHKYFDDSYEIQYGYRKPCFDCILRIRDKRTTGITCQEIDAIGCKGIFIEIYPFDHVNDNDKRQKQIKKSMFLYKIMDLKRLNLCECTGRKKIKRLIAGLIPPKLLWKLYIENCKKQNGNETAYVDCIGVPSYAAKGEGLIPINDIVKSQIVPFEYLNTRVPLNCDLYLQELYGNYMELPPIEERGKFHNNIVFYDPNNPYSKYENSELLLSFFSDRNVKDFL